MDNIQLSLFLYSTQEFSVIIKRPQLINYLPPLGKLPRPQGWGGHSVRSADMVTVHFLGTGLN